MKRAIMILAIALAACGDKTPPAVPSDRIVTVDVPVAVQPIKPADVPAVPAPLGPRPSTTQQQEDALLAKVCEFVGYALRADPLLRLSAGEKPLELPRFPECEVRP